MQKKVLTSVWAIFLLLNSSIFAQVKNQNFNYFPDTSPVAGKSTENTDYKKFFLGFAFGINSPSGFLGPNFEFLVVNGFTGTVSLGLSTWGYKGTFTGKYYLNYPRKSAFGVGISHCTGVSNFSQTITYTNSNGQQVSKEITMQLKPAHAINLSWLRYWRLGKHSRVHLELGYSLPIEGKSGRLVVLKSNETDPFLIDEFNKQYRSRIALFQPGGLIISSGFTFGL